MQLHMARHSAFGIGMLYIPGQTALFGCPANILIAGKVLLEYTFVKGENFWTAPVIRLELADVM
jgi:hypothetical protein